MWVMFKSANLGVGSILEVNMTKEKLVEKIRDLLKTDNDLDFLLELKKEEIERLVACIRDRVDKVGG